MHQGAGRARVRVVEEVKCSRVSSDWVNRQKVGLILAGSRERVRDAGEIFLGLCIEMNASDGFGELECVLCALLNLRDRVQIFR